MAGTDPINDMTVTSVDLETTSVDLETRKAIQRLRKLLIFPNEVHLFTMESAHIHNDDGTVEGCAGCFGTERWISDRYVMVKVTGDPALKLARNVACANGCPEGEQGRHKFSCDLARDFPDGGYKLTAGKGLVPKPDAYLPDSAGLLASIEERSAGKWEQMFRTDWSMADSDMNLMLAYSFTGEMDNQPIPQPIRQPHAVNEGIWNAFLHSYEDKSLVFECAPDAPYRVVHEYHGVVGYIAAAHFPAVPNVQKVVQVA